MSRDHKPSNGDHRTAAEWFVELDRDRLSKREASELAAWLASGQAHEAAFDRCQAAALLTTKLRDRPGVDWAFREAAELAALRVASRRARPAPRWFQRPGPAWAVAGLALAVAAAALAPLPGMHGPERLDSGTQQLVGTTELAAARDPAFAQEPPGVQEPVGTAEPLPSATIGVPYHEPTALLPGEVVVDARSVAVLPFRNATLDGADGSLPMEDIAAALNEAVVRQLAALPGVYVVAHDAVQGYAGGDFEAQDIATQLGVRSVVEGWMDTTGGRVRLRLRLTDAANATVVDTTFDHPLESVRAMHTDVVRTIGLALNTAPRSETRPASVFPQFGETR